MALDLTPLRWDWSPVVSGDSYPAATITCTGQTENLARVRITVRAAGSTSDALVLDSATSGITLTTTTAASWAFTIDAITNVALAAGEYSYQLETTTTGSTRRTSFAGTWKIISDIIS
jgi:hypothetical protein